ncbi:hypothetical protein ACFRAI_27290 [Streptomyces sp. NPDC056637]|uniref:hypothetical protein n=1 Tax=unclassified Streptomyces TaxID=2593676 RepID=UPI00362E6D2B
MTAGDARHRCRGHRELVCNPDWAVAVGAGNAPCAMATWRNPRGRSIEKKSAFLKKICPIFQEMPSNSRLDAYLHRGKFQREACNGDLQ